MAIYHQDIADIELNSGSLHRSFLGHSIGLGDAAANRFGVRIFRDGVAETLSGVTCQGFFQNANGQNIALTSYGTVSGNVAYVTLPQACYNVEGRFTLAIKLVGGGVTGTMRIVDGMVDNTNTGGAVAPTGSVPTYQEVLSVYSQMQAALDDYADVVATQNGQIDDLKSAIEEYTGNLISDGYTEVSGYYIDKTNDTLVANANLSCIVFPIRPSTTYYIKKDTATITRAATAANNNIVVNKPFNAVVRHNTASSEYMMITSSANDHYMFIQLYGTSDAADLRNNAANVASLVVYPIAKSLWDYCDDLNLNFANLYIVGANEKYQTIQSACDAASTGDTVLILPGVYEEQVSVWGKKLNIVGLHRDSCILIDNSGNYDNPPLEMNIGSLANLTIHETGSETDSSLADGKYNTAYCLHIDNSTNTNGETIKIRNCTFINDVHACVGIGLYANYEVEFVDCEFKQTDEKSRSGYERAAVYFHTNSNTDIDGQKISFKNCDITTTETYTLWAGRPGGSSGTAECLMIGNRMWSDISGNASASIYSDFNSWFVLSALSSGNSVEALNIKTPLELPNRIVKSANVLGSNYTILENLYIHGTDDRIYYNATVGQRMISVPIEANKKYLIVKNIPSVMRVGTGYLQIPYNNYALSSKAVQSSASIEPIIITSKTGDRYLYIQMYIDADTVKNIAKYIQNCYIYEIGIELNEIRDYFPYTLGSVNQVARLGWRDGTPEQSIASYKSAYRHGCRIMLCDVRITADGKYICWHDENLTSIARNADGTALSDAEKAQLVADLTLAQLNNYDYGIYAGAAYAGTKILELEDFLAWCSAANCWAFLEIKVQVSVAQITEISNLIKAYHLASRCFVLNFFTLDSAERTQAWCTNLPSAKFVVGSAYLNFDTAWTVAMRYKNAGVDVCLGFSSTEALTSEIIRTVQENNVALWYSEIASEEEMEAFWPIYGKYYSLISSSAFSIYDWIYNNVAAD